MKHIVFTLGLSKGKKRKHKAYNELSDRLSNTSQFKKRFY